jgi:TonB-dependent receptor
LIPFASNNYTAATCSTAVDQWSRSFDKDKTAALDLSRKFSIDQSLTDEIKVGGKYRDKDRTRLKGSALAPYYTNNPNESLTGTRFDGITSGSTFNATYFVDNPVNNRTLFDNYLLKPILDKDAVLAWRSLSIDGADYFDNPMAGIENYALAEKVSAGYIMNTLNIGQDATVILGARIEQEKNDYNATYCPTYVNTTGTGSALYVNSSTWKLRDTLASYSETNVLPNVHIVLKPTSYMNVRLAGYEALARPDFNLRLPKYVAYGASAKYFTVGNTNLQDARAYNFEINTSVYSNTIGLISFSAYYKKIDHMFHILNEAPVSGDSLSSAYGVTQKSPIAGTYLLTMPYNSNKPTKVWGFEFEHQCNSGFLPGYWGNFVLSYNLSITRSETYLLQNDTVTVYVSDPIFGSLPTVKNFMVQKKHKMEDQPEFYGNVSLGYDLGDFSARVSMFFNDKYTTSYNADGSHVDVNSFKRWDLSLKQQLTHNIALTLIVNNFTNAREGTSKQSQYQSSWYWLTSEERYGMTADLGLKVTL